jgi:hypothetical protein
MKKINENKTNVINVKLTLNDISLSNFNRIPTFKNLLPISIIRNLKVGDNFINVNNTIWGALQRMSEPGNYLVSKNESINEINMDFDTYNKIKGKINPSDKKDITITSDTQIESIDYVNDINDNMPIKYLSNVRDNKTDKISEPFTLNNKKYQLVRGIKPNKEIVNAIYCFDEIDEDGENKIYPSDYFEKNFVNPMKETMGMMGSNIQPIPEDKKFSLSEFKHFIVNNKTGKFRKFKTIEEVAKSNMTDDETYMNNRRFRKYFDETLFGKKSGKDSISINENIIVLKKKDIENNI